MHQSHLLRDHAVQRIPRYKMLLDELLKQTVKENPQHRDLTDIRLAVKEVGAAAMIINETIRLHENQEEVLAIQQMLGGQLRLLTNTRALQKQGELLMLRLPGAREGNGGGAESGGGVESVGGAEDNGRGAEASGLAEEVEGVQTGALEGVVTTSESTSESTTVSSGASSIASSSADSSGGLLAVQGWGGDELSDELSSDDMSSGSASWANITPACVQPALMAGCVQPAPSAESVEAMHLHLFNDLFLYSEPACLLHTLHLRWQLALDHAEVDTVVHAHVRVRDLHHRLEYKGAALDWDCAFAVSFSMPAALAALSNVGRRDEEEYALTRQQHGAAVADGLIGTVAAPSSHRSSARGSTQNSRGSVHKGSRRGSVGGVRGRVDSVRGRRDSVRRGSITIANSVRRGSRRSIGQRGSLNSSSNSSNNISSASMVSRSSIGRGSITGANRSSIGRGSITGGLGSVISSRGSIADEASRGAHPMPFGSSQECCLVFFARSPSERAQWVHAFDAVSTAIRTARQRQQQQQREREEQDRVSVEGAAPAAPADAPAAAPAAPVLVTHRSMEAMGRRLSAARIATPLSSISRRFSASGNTSRGSVGGSSRGSVGAGSRGSVGGASSVHRRSIQALGEQGQQGVQSAASSSSSLSPLAHSSGRRRSVAQCAQCHSAFGMFAGSMHRTRKMCRFCSGVVCKDCCSKTFFLHNIDAASPVPVCNRCHKVLAMVESLGARWRRRLTLHSGWMYLLSTSSRGGRAWHRCWFELKTYGLVVWSQDVLGSGQDANRDANRECHGRRQLQRNEFDNEFDNELADRPPHWQAYPTGDISMHSHCTVRLYHPPQARC
jgi:hypothetical protein